jgi:Zn-dependent protease with chaperone function
MRFDPALRSEKERPLFVLCFLFSAAVWTAVVVTLVGIPSALFMILFLLAGHAVFLAHVKGNGVRLSEDQLPELYARCKAAAYKLGLDEVPEVYVLQSGGVLNAFATKLLSRRFVIIFSELVNQCHDPRQLDFVIGHEMGHLAAGHLAWNAFLAPSQLVPWLGPAYSRAREYTSDRCGHAFVGELEPALRGLVVLAAGGKLAANVDLQEYMKQCAETGHFWMAVRELCMTHPYLCKRAAALADREAPRAARTVRRNPFAYLFAPMFGVSVGSASSLAVLFGLYMAFVLYQLPRMKERVPIAPPHAATWDSSAR